MNGRVQQGVRYWGFLAIKLLSSCAIAAVFLCEINYSWTPRYPLPQLNWGLFGIDLLYTTLVLLWFLFLSGLVYLSVSWSRMLQLGRPKVEYICIYGHGTLNISELQISGAENPEWKQKGDIWSELFAADPDKK
jgi:hypothetical protein